ncbi:MAG TPA: phosphatidylglycerol lysyltransferase domain-containing protein [Pirellulaceae bacterium]|nr:phosphatidylglycerol lysyltransferase domain-containing protein [Pirellulaceae bacterium]
MSTTNLQSGSFRSTSVLSEELRHSPTYWSHISAPTAPSAVSEQERQSLLRQYGNFTLAFSIAVQRHLEYFGDASGVIAFRRRRGLIFALGDPLCAPQNRHALLARFIKKYRRPSFVQITRSTAESLQALGFWVNEIGVDTRLNLSTYDFKGKDKEWLRYADNWTARRGFRVEEFSLVEREAEVAALSEEWRASRLIKRKEVRFLNRPIVMLDEPDVRRFGCFAPDGRLEAFVSFDPLFDSGSVIGFTSCIKRRHPDSNRYAEHVIMKKAIEQFQREGVSWVTLGLSPLANIEDREFRANRWLSGWLRYYYRAGWINRKYYHLIGHADYKRRFQGDEEKVYYASPVRFNGIRLLTLASLCGIF